MRLLLAVLTMLLCACGVNPQSTQQGKMASVTEARDYVNKLKLEGVEMKATKSFGGQELVEITGKISNNGSRALQRVDLSCVFYDPNGQIILRQSAPMVRADRGGLKAGEQKEFRLAFDNVPSFWNQTMPQMVMAGIAFQ